MEEMNIVTKSYRKGDYQIDLVITTDAKGNVNTDVWIGRVGGAMKLFMFDLHNKELTEVMKIVEESLTVDDTYTGGLDLVDVYDR